MVKFNIIELINTPQLESLKRSYLESLINSLQLITKKIIKKISKFKKICPIFNDTFILYKHVFHIHLYRITLKFAKWS